MKHKLELRAEKKMFSSPGEMQIKPGVHHTKVHPQSDIHFSQESLSQNSLLLEFPEGALLLPDPHGAVFLVVSAAASLAARCKSFQGGAVLPQNHLGMAFWAASEPVPNLTQKF